MNTKNNNTFRNRKSVIYLYEQDTQKNYYNEINEVYETF